ncbi:hypothetical protein Noda2021_07590 [Candidatus Dependentiae bacterium Noda2021]|nr:hypothetical protein Noda2021_07590 [Candidatus Dependentiae bacterium Noda2021]
MKPLPLCLKLLLITLLGNAIATCNMPYAVVTPSFANALNKLHDRIWPDQAMLAIECDSCMSIEHAQKTLQDAADALSGLVDCDTKTYNEIARALHEYERDLVSGANLVDSDYVLTRGCKVFDSLCVRNSIGVAGDALIRGQVRSDSVTTNVLNSPSINSANIITSEINGFAVGASGSLLPAANYFYATKVTDQIHTPAIAFEIITMDPATLIEGWTQVSGVFTATTSGIYQVTYSVGAATTSGTQQTIATQLYLSGTAVVGTYLQTFIPPLEITNLSMTALVSVSAGQTIDVRFAASSTVRVGGTFRPCTLSVTKI